MENRKYLQLLGSNSFNWAIYLTLIPGKIYWVRSLGGEIPRT